MLPTIYYDRMLNIAKNCIDKSFDDAQAVWDEPDYCAHFSKNVATEIFGKWASILAPSGVAISLVSGFIHQSPIVEIVGKAKPNSCELGDLLIVVQHEVGGVIFSRGAFMQVKIGGGNLKNLTKPQLFLYNKWPKFLCKRGVLRRGIRNFRRGKKYDGRSGVYGVITRGTRIWRIQDAFCRFYNEGFADFITNLAFSSDPRQVNRKNNYGRQIYNRSRFDWSGTVKELLCDSGTFLRSKFAQTRLPRIPPAMLLLMDEKIPLRKAVADDIETVRKSRESIAVVVLQVQGVQEETDGREE